MFRIRNLSLPWKALVLHADTDTMESDLDAVSKSLLINNKGEPAVAEEDDTPEEIEEPSDAPSDDISEDTPEDTPDAEEPSDEESEESDDTSEAPDDIDSIEIEVTVDGETKNVTLAELKARYSGGEAIDKRLQEVSEIKTKVLTTGNALYKVLTEQANRLQMLDGVLQQQVEAPINWEELRVKDPGKYLLERERVRDLEDQRRRVAEENWRIQQQKAELDSLAYQEYATEQLKQVTQKIPEFRDPVKTREIVAELSEAAQYYGLTSDELGAVVDHRHMMILVDAARYRKSLKEKTGKTTNKKIELLKARPLLKVGTASQKVNQMTSAKKQQLATLKKAKATGSVDDVARLLMVKKK